MNSTLTKHLKTKQEKDKFKERLQHNKDLLSVFAELVISKIDKSKKGQQAEGGYDSPAWAYKQADSIGEQRALQQVLDLLQLR